VAGWLTGIELNRLHRAGKLPGFTPSTAGDAGKKHRQSSSGPTRPSDLMGTITVIAAVFGVLGSKLFHILENLDSFSRDPAGMIFSTGGLTFYGGLICGGIAIVWYLTRKRIPVPRFADAVAPGLMLAYGIGRIGCHLAGDGDWGIASSLEAKPAWIPGWLWAETYPNNILGVTLPGDGVYPTSIYEFLMAAALFLLLWSLRKHSFIAGWLFSLYLVLNGLERLLIEQIRVNNTYSLFGLEATQAEIIASILVLAGIVLLALTSRRVPAPETVDT
jgi:phosphatidylglycerol:prolipoprotein diacylglycerol transferase